MAERTRWQRLFGTPCPLIGVVHLGPLPGSPGWGGDLVALEGADGLIVENFGDAPFFAGPVPPETVAAMARIAAAVVAEVAPLPVGINVLRNDALAALGVAVASGGRFLRVNVLCGATVTDQGLIQGQAAELLRRRRLLAADDPLDGMAILADVHVKHGVPLAPQGLEEAVRDTLGRGGADGVIVSGSGTGAPTALADLERARSAAAGAPVLVGSGCSAAQAGLLGPHCDGVIVGTALKRQGRLEQPVDAQRVGQLRRLLPQSLQ
jgi:membrane complex biogenesis BtpA family protein